MVADPKKSPGLTVPEAELMRLFKERTDRITALEIEGPLSEAIFIEETRELEKICNALLAKRLAKAVIELSPEDRMNLEKVENAIIVAMHLFLDNLESGEFPGQA
jgi:hypothetical protein